MRSVAAGRALRVPRARWSIATSARRTVPLSVWAPKCYSSSNRSYISQPQQWNYQQLKAIRTYSTSSRSPLTIEGQSYQTDEWTNTSPTILSHVGRRLYLEENHPLAITRRLIESQFAAPVYGNFVEENPVVTTAQNFDVLGFPADHPGRSRTDTYYVKSVLE